MKINNKHKNITAINALMSLTLQIVTIASGFIIPRLILKTFGSETNGLISSLNQFLNYISLLEGGVSSVILANLYKPLLNNDIEKLSSVVRTTQKFFKKIAIVFLFYSIVLAICYPLIFHTSFSYKYVSVLALILSINLFIQYNFSLSWKLVLNADKKVYQVSIIQIILIVLNTGLFAILIKFFPNIHFLKLVTALVFILQPIIYNIIIKKNYNLDKNAPIDNNLLKERWSGFGINIAYFIHYNTDVTILTIFTDLKIVSIYAVYSLVTSGLRQLVISISSGISPSLGHAYNSGDKEKLNSFFARYEYIILLSTFFLFTVGGLLITPFVSLYTKGVTDINYYQPLFGILIIISEAIYCIREPFVSLAYSAKKFKKITKHAYIEAILNIAVSLLLVTKLGIIGVAIGTLVGMSYRTIYHIIFLKHDVLYRPISKFVKNLGIFLLTTILGVAICVILFSINNLTIINWLIYAIIYCLVFIILYSIITFIFFKQEFVYYKGIILNKLKK